MTFYPKTNRIRPHFEKRAKILVFAWVSLFMVSCQDSEIAPSEQSAPILEISEAYDQPLRYLGKRVRLKGIFRVRPNGRTGQIMVGPGLETMRQTVQVASKVDMDSKFSDKSIVLLGILDLLNIKFITNPPGQLLREDVSTPAPYTEFDSYVLILRDAELVEGMDFELRAD